MFIGRVCCKLLACQVLLKGSKEMERKIGTVRRMVHNLPALVP
jgi:hypothetical protein